MRATVAASWATAYLAGTFAVVAEFRFFGGMRVVRFRDALLVLAIVDRQIIPYSVQPLVAARVQELYQDLSHQDGPFMHHLKQVIPVPKHILSPKLQNIMLKRLRQWIVSRERIRAESLLVSWDNGKQKELEDARANLLRLEMAEQFVTLDL